MKKTTYPTYKAMVEDMDEVAKEGKDFLACADKEKEEYWLEAEE